MIFLGHIAAGLIAADALDGDPGAAAAGAVFPDLVDKTGGWLLRVMPSGRWLAHGLPFFGLCALATLPLADRRRRRGFVLGYAAHLATDLYAGGHVPWLAPFGRRPAARRRPFDTLRLAENVAAEIMGAAVLWSRRRWRSSEPAWSRRARASARSRVWETSAG